MKIRLKLRYLGDLRSVQFGCVILSSYFFALNCKHVINMLQSSLNGLRRVKVKREINSQKQNYMEVPGPSLRPATY